MSDSEIEIVWAVEDGYVGKDRPQYSKMPLDEIEDDMDDQELETLLDEWVEGEFEAQISWFVKNRETVLEKMRQARDAKAAE